MAPPSSPPRGPVEAQSWPEVLTARVITAGAQPRVHGYCVEGDLARHYRYTELALLGLTGALPTETIGRAFDVALAFAAPVSLAEAPTHVGHMLRVVGASPASVVAVAATTLTERARFVVAQHAPLLAWLAAMAHDPSADHSGERPAFPAACVSAAPEECAAVERLAAALAAVGLDPLPPGFARQPTRTAAVLATLHACGLVRPEQLEVALTFAALPLVSAEALAAVPGAFDQYPMTLPRFVYREDPVPPGAGAAMATTAATATTRGPVR